MGGITTTLFQRPRDPQFNNTTLLLSGNFPTNGAQNNTFLDSSSNGFTITRNPSTGPNAPTQGTFSPFSQTGWSNFASAASSTVGLSNTTAALIGSTVTTFTAECWIFMTEAPVSGDGVPSLIGMDAQTSSSIFLGFGPNASRNLVLRWFDGASKTATGGTALALNTWYHIAVVSNSNALAMYVNGVAETLSGTTTLTNRSGTTNQFCLFFNSSASNYQFRGYASNIRVTNTAVYTSAFTPSTAPLTAITGTQLLTAQSNRFVDNSTNAYALTVTGSPSVQAFSPFVPSGAYTTTAVGGSGYFDGTGDNLSYTTTALGSGDFTIEGWVYLLANNAFGGFWSTFNSTTGTGCWFGIKNTGVLTFEIGNGGGTSLSISSATALSRNTWIYVAARRSGTSVNIYVDGSSVASGTSSANLSNTSAVVARLYNNLSQDFINGYISSLRVSSNARTISTPTSPFVSDANTLLLLNFTNAGIVDSTAKNVLETVGNAQISTTQSKFGGSSLYSDGTGDRLIGPNSPNLNIQGGNWTLEAWVYPETTAGYRNIVTKRGGANFEWGMGVYNGNLYFFNGTLYTGGAVSTNTWSHVAAVRNGTTTTLYVNGVGTSIGNVDSGNVSTGILVVFAEPGGTEVWQGYIDEIRITKGVARYTANFNVPTIGFTDR